MENKKKHAACERECEDVAAYKKRIAKRLKAVEEVFDRAVAVDTSGEVGDREIQAMALAAQSALFYARLLLGEASSRKVRKSVQEMSESEAAFVIMGGSVETFKDVAKK